MKCLRTFLPLPHKMMDSSYLANCVPYDLLHNLKFLRVLSFSRYKMKELPNSIGDLKHLRYLDVSYTQIEVLPDSTTSLYNLQTLILKACRSLMRLPARMDNLINLRHLDITGTDMIERMPLEIKELSSLRKLPEIAISKEFFTITNLTSLKSLRGELSISKLGNVVDALDVTKAKIKDMEAIHVLRLSWRDTYSFLEHEVDQYDVLDELKPHRNLKKLIITCYAGTKFPSWIGNPMFNNMEQLTLESCNKCTSLVSLGMLPNLKELFIREMHSLQRIDEEFYGNVFSNPFPRLEVLCFENMPNWEKWNSCDEFKFGVLRELSIRNCGKLSGKLPIHLPSLEKLIINGCENLVALLSNFSMLSELEIKTCKEVHFKCKVDFSSFRMFVLVNISSISTLSKQFLQGLKKFKIISLSDFHTEDTDVRYSKTISNFECVFKACPQLMSMVMDEDKEQLQMELAGSELDSLRLDRCSALKKLPTWIQKLMFLRKLTIENCQSLVTLPEGTMYESQYLEQLDIVQCDSLIFLKRRQLPPVLKKLSICWCKNLKSLLLEEDEDETSSSSSNLEDLKIIYCESLTSISFGSQLPAILKCFDIHECPNLSSVLPRGKLPSRLQYLRISSCGKEELIAEKFDYNTSLEAFSISESSSLKFLPDGLHNLINLRDLELWRCPCIVSFPEGGLPTTFLRKLTIHSLEKLEALPDNMHRLSSLDELILYGCPNLVSFPSQGFPSNLTSLTIDGPKFCEAMFEWGLERLNSLQELRIFRGCLQMRSFPSDETAMMLPSSRTRLEIQDFPELEYLSTRGFHNLTSLESLWIEECPKLASFPENGLPDSLLQLHARDCPLPKQGCEKGKGPEWSKTVNVPYVFVH